MFLASSIAEIRSILDWSGNFSKHRRAFLYVIKRRDFGLKTFVMSSSIDSPFITTEEVMNIVESEKTSDSGSESTLEKTSPNLFIRAKSWQEVFQIMIETLERCISRTEFSDDFISNVIQKRLAIMTVLTPMPKDNETSPKYFHDERLKLLDVDEFDVCLSDLRFAANQIQDKFRDFYLLTNELQLMDISPQQHEIIDTCQDMWQTAINMIGEQYFSCGDSTIPFNSGVNEYQIRSMTFMYDGLFYTGNVDPLTIKRSDISPFNLNGGKYYTNTYYLKRHIPIHVHNLSTIVKRNAKSFINCLKMLQHIINRDLKLFEKKTKSMDFYY